MYIYISYFLYIYIYIYFLPNLGVSLGGDVLQSDVTFVCTLLLCKNERLYWHIVLHLLFKICFYK